jgi:hypothetical protein
VINVFQIVELATVLHHLVHLVQLDISLMELKLALNVHQCSLLTPLSAVNVLQIVIPVAIQLLHVQHVQLAISSMEAICVQNV